MSDRMYACLEIKSVEAVGKKRIFTGTASTVETDRTGDVVEAKGAQFKLPLPLLWQHDKNQPIGWVTSAKVTANGIEVVGEVAEVEDEGDLKRRLDTVWQTLKAKLVRGLSIGFRAIDAEPIKGTFGIRFLKWEWLELSAVTVAANASASIATIKSLDTAQLAASGKKAASVVQLDPAPGASGKTTLSKPQEGHAMKTIQEQLADLEANIAAKQSRMSEIMQKTSGEGRSTDAAEAEEFDTLSADVTTLQADLGRLKSLDTINKGSLTPVGTPRTVVEGAAVRHGVEIRKQEKLEPGIALARYGMCLFTAKGNKAEAFKLAEKFYPQTEAVVKTLKAQAEGADLNQIFITKASVAAGTTTDATWASPLVYANTFGGDFIEFLRARTLLGQANFRRIPFNVRIAGQTSGGTGYWVGQGKAKPVTKFDYNATTVPFTKVAAIAVLTQELIRFSDPDAERLVRDSLADCVIERVDSDLFDPDLAAVATVNPAGLLNGVNPVAGPTGTVDADSIRCALLRLWAPWDTTFMGQRPAYYTTPAVARFLAFTRDAFGNPAFPGVTPNGGTLDGIPLRVSQYLANNGGSAGSPFILVDESEVFLADDGSVTVDFSTEATIEMSTTPTGAAGVPTAASVNMVSMFQSNSVALRAERFIWWGLRRSGAIQWIDGFPSSC